LQAINTFKNPEPTPQPQESTVADVTQGYAEGND
jgi:hypothetical protein